MSLEFEPKTHTYRLDGKKKPGVSEILEDVGFNDFRHVAPDVLADAQAFGTRVHRACELDDKKDLDYSSVPERELACLMGWQKFRREFGGALVLIEQPLYDPTLDVCGTPDRVFSAAGALTHLYPGVLVDIKAGTEVAKHRIQTAAYMAMWNNTRRSPRIARRACCYLRDTGTYTLRWHQDYQGDLAAFAAARALFEWRNKNGR